MNKIELIRKIAEKTDLSKKDAEKALTAFQEIVTETIVSGDKVHLVGFGTLEVIERAARLGRNPRSGAEIQIPAYKAPKFKASKAFKDAVSA